MRPTQQLTKNFFAAVASHPSETAGDSPTHSAGAVCFNSYRGFKFAQLDVNGHAFVSNKGRAKQLRFFILIGPRDAYTNIPSAKKMKAALWVRRVLIEYQCAL